MQLVHVDLANGRAPAAVRVLLARLVPGDRRAVPFVGGEVKSLHHC
jgi:hypothetical protein